MAPLSSLREVLSSLSGSDAFIGCPLCGTALKATKTNCQNCGAELTVECRDCGESIEDEVAQCPNCGGSEYEVFPLE